MYTGTYKGCTQKLGRRLIPKRRILSAVILVFSATIVLRDIGDDVSESKDKLDISKQRAASDYLNSLQKHAVFWDCLPES